MVPMRYYTFTSNKSYIFKSFKLVTSGHKEKTTRAVIPEKNTKTQSLWSCTPQSYISHVDCSLLQAAAKNKLFKDLFADYISGVDPSPTELTVGLTPRFVKYDKATNDLTVGVWEYHVSYKLLLSFPQFLSISQQVI